MVVYGSIVGNGAVRGTLWTDVPERAVQRLDGNGSRTAELGCAFWILQVVDVSAAEQSLRIGSGKCLPLGPELIRRLLVRIEISDVSCHGGRQGPRKRQSRSEVKEDTSAINLNTNDAWLMTQVGRYLRYLFLQLEI